MVDSGAKCTCPSRKFPCKHSLALMLMCAQNEADFTPAAIPDWVTEWLGRRRKTVAPTSAPELGEAKAGNSATPRPLPKPQPADPEAEAKRRAAAEKRAQETRRTVHAATEELEAWIADQLAAFPAFLADLPARCRSQTYDSPAAYKISSTQAGTMTLAMPYLLSSNTLALSEGFRFSSYVLMPFARASLTKPAAG